MQAERLGVVEAQSNRAMNTNLVRQLRASMEVEMIASRPRKGKGRGNVWPIASITIVIPGEDDVSYLPSCMIVFGSSLCNVDLVIDIVVPFSPMRTPRYWAARESMVDNMEEHT